jgi:hypothetical protein
VALTVVPPAERLTAGAIFMDADPLMKLVMAVLILAILAEIAVWAMGLIRRSQAPAETGGKLAAVIARIAGAAPLLGLFGMAYVLLNGAVALANVRPTPPMHVIAPGLAEALALAALGLAAGFVGKLARRPG